MGSVEQTPGEVRPRGLPVITSTRGWMYVGLVLAAVVALFLDPAIEGAVQRGAVDPRWAHVPVVVFGLIFVVYAADRWSLVRQGRYRASRALVMTGLGLVLTTAVVSSIVGRRVVASSALDARPRAPDRLLAHADAEVRRAAVYAVGFQGPNPDHVVRLVGRLEDRSPEVRQAAREVLGRWSGLPESDLSALRSWASSASRTSTAHAGEDH